MSVRQLWQIICCTCVMALLMPSAMLPAQQVDRLSGADEIISRANDLGEQRNYESAISLLKAARERYPTYEQLYNSLANWQASRDLSKPEAVQDIFETCGLGIMRLKDAGELRLRVNDVLKTKFPTKLGPYGVMALPGNPTPFTFNISDTRLTTDQRGVRQGLITMNPLDAGDKYRQDPKYSDPKHASGVKAGDWKFQHILYAYIFDNDQQCWELRFRVIWQQAPGKEDERLQLARQTGQLLIRLYGLLDAYTAFTGYPQLTPRFSDDGAVNVWLAENGNAGGEAYNENIYLYSVGTPRSGAEWVRELSHELGHQVFKPVGGYEQPEWAASGRLAEGLFMRWLADNMNDKEALPWLASFNPSELFVKRYQPFIRKFAELGPNSPQIRGVDETAMNDFIGMALYIEETQGSHYLASALSGMSVPAFAGANGFLDSLENLVELTVQSIDSPTVSLYLSELPQDIPYYVFLRDGVWKGEFQGRGLQGKTRLVIDDKVTPIDAKGSFTLTAKQVGWHQLRISSAEDASTLTVFSVKFARQ